MPHDGASIYPLSYVYNSRFAIPFNTVLVGTIPIDTVPIPKQYSIPDHTDTRYAKLCHTKQYTNIAIE